MKLNGIFNVIIFDFTSSKTLIKILNLVIYF